MNLSRQILGRQRLLLLDDALITNQTPQPPWTVRSISVPTPSLKTPAKSFICWLIRRLLLTDDFVLTDAEDEPIVAGAPL